MSHARKFKRKHPAKPKPKQPQATPYPFMSQVKDDLASLAEAALRRHLPPMAAWAAEDTLNSREAVLAKLGVVLGMTDEQLAPLDRLSMDLARVTGMSAPQTLQAIAVLAECGLSADEIITKARHAYPYQRETAEEPLREVVVQKGCSVGRTSAQAVLALAMMSGLGVK